MTIVATESIVTFEEKKVLAKKIIDEFESRAKWTVFKKMVPKGSAIPLSQGFPVLKNKITTLESNLPNEILLSSIINLKSKLLSHYLAGEKSIRLFKSDKNDQLIDFLAFVESKCSPIENENNLIFSDVGLTEEPELAYIKNSTSGYYFVYLSERKIQIKESIPNDVLLDSFKSSKPSDAKYYSISSSKKRCFDIVYIPKAGNYIEYRADNDEHFSSEERNISLINLISKFSSTFCEKEFKSRLSGSIINLFPCIKKTLDLPVGDGRVVELKFTTNEGAVKEHKSRSKSTGCILADKYHLAGASEIKNQFDPYKIARVWKVTSQLGESEPELMLQGNIRMLSATNTPILHDALISNTIGEDDYRSILNKLTCLL